MKNNLLVKPNVLVRLNEPIRNNNRNPLDLLFHNKAPHFNPINRPTKQITDTKDFFYINSNIEYKINKNISSRKEKEIYLEQCIEQNNLTASDILRQISFLYEHNTNIFDIIANNLDSIEDNPVFETDLDFYYNQISESLINIDEIKYQIQNSIEENIQLRNIFEVKQKNLNDINLNLIYIQKLYNSSNFEKKELIHNMDKIKNEDINNQFTELYGENHHLRSEIKSLIEKISNQRKNQSFFTLKSAKKKIRISQIVNNEDH